MGKDKKKKKDKKENKMSEELTPVENEIPQTFTQEEITMLKKLLSFFSSSAEPQIIYEEKIVYQDKIIEKEVIKEVEKTVEVQLIDSLRENIKPIFELLEIVKQDDEFSKKWFAQEHDEGEQLIKLTATLAQWHEVEKLWDNLANRFKEEKRPASANELALLKGAVSIFNLSLDSVKAELVSTEIGISYDYEKQQRGTPTGDKVIAEWLPSLLNAGGFIVKKALVELA
jgi:hypothetical protein